MSFRSLSNNRQSKTSATWFALSDEWLKQFGSDTGRNSWTVVNYFKSRKFTLARDDDTNGRMWRGSGFQRFGSVLDQIEKRTLELVCIQILGCVREVSSLR